MVVVVVEASPDLTSGGVVTDSETECDPALY